MRHTPITRRPRASVILPASTAPSRARAPRATSSNASASAAVAAPQPLRRRQRAPPVRPMPVAPLREALLPERVHHLAHRLSHPLDLALRFGDVDLGMFCLFVYGLFVPRHLTPNKESAATLPCQHVAAGCDPTPAPPRSWHTGAVSRGMFARILREGRSIIIDRFQATRERTCERSAESARRRLASERASTGAPAPLSPRAHVSRCRTEIDRSMVNGRIMFGGHAPPEASASRCRRQSWRCGSRKPAAPRVARGFVPFVIGTRGGRVASGRRQGAIHRLAPRSDRLAGPN